MNELIEAVKQLKKMLGPDGEYSICRADKKLMELPELVLVGDVLERIDKALVAAEQAVSVDRAPRGN